jgi:hypothetical protein
MQSALSPVHAQPHPLFLALYRDEHSRNRQWPTCRSPSAPLSLVKGLDIPDHEKAATGILANLPQSL